MTINASTAPGDIQGTSIVLVGPCDPAMLQPSALLKNGLISETDVATLRYEMLVAEVAVARLSWAQIVVERGKLSVTTTLESPAGEPIRDFVLSFVELLPTRRFTALGINREQHFGVPNEEHWHKIGHALVPKEPVWNNILKKPGMSSLTVQGERSDGFAGQINVRIEPSKELKPGVFVHINDHYDVAPQATNEEPDKLLDLLSAGWDDAMRRSDEIISKLKEISQ